MKKIIITSIFLLATSTSMWSQKFSVDIRFGISPGANPVTAAFIGNRHNPYDEMLVNLVHEKPQFYGGIRIHKPLSAPFFLESGITYTKRSSHYQITYRLPQAEPVSQESLMQESEDLIQLPLEIGVSLGNIDVTSGLSITKTISAQNELTHLKGFSSDDNFLKWGWQMGVRYAFKRTMAGVEYQGTMQRTCQGMYINNKPLDIMNVPGRFVFTLQYRF